MVAVFENALIYSRFYRQILMSVQEPQANADLTHFATIHTDHTLAHAIPDTRGMERNVKVNCVQVLYLCYKESSEKQVASLIQW